MDREFIQQQNDLRTDYTVGKKFTPVVEVWRSRPTKGLLFLIVFAIVVPVLIYYFLFDRATSADSAENTCAVKKSYRIQCGRTENVTLAYCTNIHCCFDDTTKTCFHYLPSKYYYSFSQSSLQKSLEKTPFDKLQAETVALSVQELDQDNVKFILHDPSISFENRTGLPNRNYDYTISSNPLFVDVFRNSTGELILTTSRGPTIISDNYWEWSFQLTDQYLFGLGQTLIELDENSTLTKVVYGNRDDHNTLPVFLAYSNGSYHGLIVRTSGPLEITVLPSNLVSLKSLVGNQISLELSVGPTIQKVRQQQMREKEEVSVDLPMLGVHICREGDLTTLRDIINDYTSEKNLDNATVYDSDCLHENLLLASGYENNASVTALLDLISRWIVSPGSRFTLAIPPQVYSNSSLYHNTANLSIFFKSNATEDYQGKHLGIDVVYPYFSHTNIEQFVNASIQEAKSYFKLLWPTDFILPKNWPSDESFEMTETDNFQYLSQALLDAMSFTLPWDVTSSNGSQFLDHNEYGAFQLNQIQNILSLENPRVMTASHRFEDSLPIIIQNVDASWTNFKKAINTLLSNSLFGFPLTSIPVCGSTSNFDASHESLCMRWYLMALTAPIFRISSDLPRRDPSYFGSLTSQHAGNVARQAIKLRYSLQYYFYEVLNSGEPLMRPMFYDFPNDLATFGLVEQYMVGPHLLVAHPTLPDQSQIKIYLPRADNIIWFEFWGGGNFNYDSGTDGLITLPLVETDWVCFIREESVVSLVEKSVDDATIKNVKLKVALKCNGNVSCNAAGTLKISSTNWFNFTSTDQQLSVEIQGTDDTFVLTEIQVFHPNGNSSIIKADTGIKLNDITECSYNPFNCIPII